MVWCFVDAVLPIYLALEHKPDNGGEIQNLANITLGIMLRLKVVKRAIEEKGIAATTATGMDDNNNATNEGEKGMQVLLELMEPWHHSSRLVTANAYFASLKAALKLKEKDLFLLVVSSSAVGGPPWSWEYHTPKARIVIGPCIY
jgi:hypothetical protein